MKNLTVFFALLIFPVLGCSTPLHDAVLRGDISAVKEMLDKGANVNETIAPNGATPLYYSQFLGRKGENEDMVKLLIERGATVDTSASTCLNCPADATPLAVAAYYGKVKTMKVLIEHGADIDKAIVGLEEQAHHGGWMRDSGMQKYAVKLLERMKKEAEYAPPAAAASLSASKRSDIDDLPMIRTPQNKNSYAIIIGIESYRQKLPKADFAGSDAKIVEIYLEKVLGYPEKNVVTLVNEQAAKSDFEKYFERWLVNNVEKDATVLVYFSGHGAPNPKTGDAYLVPYDGDPMFIEETGYSLKRMYAALGKLPAKEIVVALDSCFSGAGGRSVIAKGSRPLVMNLNTATSLPKNVTVLSASAGDQTSSTYEEKGHGLFTYFLLKGIKNEEVVTRDGSLDVSALYDYIKLQVTSIARKKYNNEQTPQLIGRQN